MKRDMELIRKILFAIEEQYKPGEGVLRGLNIEGYDMRTVAEHCDLLYQRGFIKSYKYKEVSGADTIRYFIVGNLSSSGYDYLELIRNDEVWKKTTVEIEKKQLPWTFEAIAKIAGIFVGNVISQMSGLP